VILLVQIYIQYDYVIKKDSRYDKDLMCKVNLFINKNSLYMADLFEEVIGRCHESFSFSIGWILLIVTFIHIISGLCSIVGIICNCVSLYKNKKIFSQMCLFIYTSVIGCFELYYAIEDEKNILTFSNSNLDIYKDKELIKERIKIVKSISLFIIIYSVLLIVIPIFHLLINVYIIKNINKSVILTKLEEKTNDSSSENYLIFNENESNK